MSGFDVGIEMREKHTQSEKLVHSIYLRSLFFVINIGVQ